MRERIDLNRDWLFTEDHEDFSGAVRVSLPHTCRETPYDYFDESAYQMVCAYRRTIDAPEAWAGKRVFLFGVGVQENGKARPDALKAFFKHFRFTCADDDPIPVLRGFSRKPVPDVSADDIAFHASPFRKSRTTCAVCSGV